MLGASGIESKNGHHLILTARNQLLLLPLWRRDSFDYTLKEITFIICKYHHCCFSSCCIHLLSHHFICASTFFFIHLLFRTQQPGYVRLNVSGIADYVTVSSPLATPNVLVPLYSRSCCWQCYLSSSQIRNFDSFTSLTFHIQLATESQTCYLFGVSQSLLSAHASCLPIYYMLASQHALPLGESPHKASRGKSGHVTFLLKIFSVSLLSTR